MGQGTFTLQRDKHHLPVFSWDLNCYNDPVQRHIKALSHAYSAFLFIILYLHPGAHWMRNQHATLLLGYQFAHQKDINNIGSPQRIAEN